MKSIRNVLTLIVVVPALLCATGCATLSNRAKTILLMVGAGSVGATVGALTAPADENKAAHGLMWGGASAAVAGASGLFLFDSESDKEKLSAENRRLSAELERFSKETEPIPVGSVRDGADMPSQVRELIHPGRWQLYQIGEKGQWLKQTEHKWVHQDQLLMYLPGGISPGGVNSPALSSPGLSHPNQNQPAESQ